MTLMDIKSGGKDSGTSADSGPENVSFLLDEKLVGLKNVMRALFTIALPILPFFIIYNLLKYRYIDAILVCIMWLLLIYSYFNFRQKSRTPEDQYRIYQNVIRGFLLFFLMYISFSSIYKGNLDRLLWSYFFPLVAFLGLGRKESIRWGIFFIAFMSLILFLPRPEFLPPEILYPDDAIGFKLRYIISFSVICAIGIAWKLGIENNYSRLALRQAQIADSEKQYRKAYEELHREMDERQKVQQALAESEEKYRLIFENSFDVIYSMDREFRCIDVSPSIEKTLGYSPSELIGRPFYELGLVAPESMENVFADILRIFNGATIPVASYTFIARDGARLYGEISEAPIIRNGKVEGIISVARDITGRKSAEKALQESLKRFQIIVENTRDVIWMMDLDFHFTFISPAIEQMLGYTVEKFMTIPHHETIEHDSLGLLFKALEETLTLEKDSQKDLYLSRIVELEQIHKNGSKIWVELKMNIIKDIEGKPTGILGFSRDITEFKHAEEEKRKLEEHIQHIARIDSLGTLAGGIAHDFNNLLMAIQGYTSLVMMNTEPSHPNYSRLRRIEEQVQSGADLTGQMLGFARGGRYEVKPTNINEIIEKTSSTFGRTRKEISIHRRFCKDIWTVEVDRGQMEQVFMNLYVNSSEAITGNGDIYVETENFTLDEKHIHSSKVLPGRYVKISVTDTGSGIDMKIRDKIFDPFFTTKDKKRGTGLGLATVYGIIKGHSGMINVYSEPGHGTTFTVYLPVTDKEIVNEKNESSAITMGRESILLVDDENSVLEVNTELLQSMGYTVFAVGSSREALTVFEKEKDKIDLVVLDMIMPELSGDDVFNHLRKINPGVKILLSSGYSLNGKARTIMDKGCNGFLQKPFDKEKLSKKIREILDQ